jgi:mevalonate kinase
VQTPLGEGPSASLADVINGWAFAAETILHGKPSGLDNTVSCYGGAIRYKKPGGSWRVIIIIIIIITIIILILVVLVMMVKTVHDHRWPSLMTYR